MRSFCFNIYVYICMYLEHFPTRKLPSESSNPAAKRLKLVLCVELFMVYLYNWQNGWIICICYIDRYHLYIHTLCTRICLCLPRFASAQNCSVFSWNGLEPISSRTDSAHFRAINSFSWVLNSGKLHSLSLNTAFGNCTNFWDDEFDENTINTISSTHW